MDARRRAAGGRPGGSLVFCKSILEVDPGRATGRAVSSKQLGRVFHFKSMARPVPRCTPVAARSRFRARRSNGDLGGGLHLCLMDMTAFGASDGPVLEAGAGRRNALDRHATLASRAAR